MSSHASLEPVVHFINETFKHCKPLAAFGNGIDLLAASSPPAIGLSNSASSTSAAEPSEESFATKISAGVSKVAQKAVSAMSEAVPQGMEQEAGVITSWGGAISKALGGLKASMLKQRIWKREDE